MERERRYQWKGEINKAVSHFLFVIIERSGSGNCRSKIASGVLALRLRCLKKEGSGARASDTDRYPYR